MLVRTDTNGRTFEGVVVTLLVKDGERSNAAEER
jgi:hypothetical protein